MAFDDPPSFSIPTISLLVVFNDILGRSHFVLDTGDWGNVRTLGDVRFLGDVLTLKDLPFLGDFRTLGNYVT